MNEEIIIKPQGFIDGLALGLASGVIFTLLICWALTDLGTRLGDNVVGFGTMIATLSAAFLALRGVRASIDHQNQLEQRRRRQKLQAARATLPIVLGSMYEMCRNRMEFIVSGEEKDTKKPWSIEQTSISTLEKCIEFSQGSSRSALEEILQIYQILLARFEDLECPDNLFSNDGGTGSYFRIDALIQWACLQALIEALFSFGRGRSDKVDRASVHSRAVKHLNYLSDPSGYTYTNFEDFRKAVEHFEQHNNSFSNPDWKGVN